MIYLRTPTNVHIHTAILLHYTNAWAHELLLFLCKTLFLHLFRRKKCNDTMEQILVLISSHPFNTLYIQLAPCLPQPPSQRLEQLNQYPDFNNYLIFVLTKLKSEGKLPFCLFLSVVLSHVYRVPRSSNGNGRSEHVIFM